MPALKAWRKIKYRVKRSLGQQEKYRIKNTGSGILDEGYESTIHPVELHPKSKLLKGKFNAVLKKMKATQLSTSQQAFALPPRQRVINSRKAWRALKDAGLPVPSFFTPIIRRGASIKSSGILMENLEKKYGKLIPVNTHMGSSAPSFLTELSIKRDKKLIGELAHDFATIINKGFIPYAADFWAFYRNPKTHRFERIILDTTFFAHLSSAKTAKERSEMKYNRGVFCFGQIREFLKSEEFVEFTKNLLMKLKDSEFRDMLYQKYLINSVR